MKPTTLTQIYNSGGQYIEPDPETTKTIDIPTAIAVGAQALMDAIAAKEAEKQAEWNKKYNETKAKKDAQAQAQKEADAYLEARFRNIDDQELENLINKTARGMLAKDAAASKEEIAELKNEIARLKKRVAFAEDFI